MPGLKDVMQKTLTPEELAQQQRFEAISRQFERDQQRLREYTELGRTVQNYGTQTIKLSLVVAAVGVAAGGTL
jgi:hypothetical protein